MQLKSYLREHGLTVADFAPQVELSVGGLHKILNGQRKASLLVADRIEKATGGQVRRAEVMKPLPEGWAITKRKAAA